MHKNISRTVSRVETAKRRFGITST